jgi:hypothetical protein
MVYGYGSNFVIPEQAKASRPIHDCGSDRLGAIGVFPGMTQNAMVAHTLIHEIRPRTQTANGFVSSRSSSNHGPIRFARGA